MSDDGRQPPRPRPRRTAGPTVGRFEAVLAGALAVVALTAAALGSGWWWPALVAALAVLVVGLVQPVLRRRVLDRRARERGAAPR